MNKKIYFIFIISICITLIFTFIFYKKTSKNTVESWEINSEIPDIYSNQYESWGRKALHIQDSKTVRHVKVAIIDSGIDRNHIDLKGIIKLEYNAINERETVIDNTGHGTAVAGIIAANNNNLGIKGVVDSSIVEIYSIKAFENNSSKLEYLIKSFDWAIENDVDLINFSAGISYENKKLTEIINSALEKNIIIVAAAGNNATGKVDYPARLDNVISVGAVNYKYKKVSGTSFGKIDFVGPGSNILTTFPNNTYGYFGYTSAATAFVSGVIINLISKYPNKDSYNVEKVIHELKENAISLEESQKYGHGFIQNN